MSERPEIKNDHDLQRELRRAWYLDFGKYWCNDPTGERVEEWLREAEDFERQEREERERESEDAGADKIEGMQMNSCEFRALTQGIDGTPEFWELLSVQPPGVVAHVVDEIWDAGGACTLYDLRRWIEEAAC